MANSNSMSFNITKDDYKTFIENLRTELSHSTSHDIPVLMPQSEPLSWLDVRLISGDRSITIRIDRRNLYVRGYCRHGDDRFWEFKDSTMINNSQRLNYSGSYADGFCRTAGVNRDKLKLSYFQLDDAIHYLADTANPNTETERSAWGLLIITQMIAEAARNKLIADHISQNWFNPQSITAQMLCLENQWGAYSSAVQRADSGGAADTPLPNVSNQNLIRTVADAIAAFGILLYDQQSRPRVKRDVAQSSSDASYIRTLVNIEYVRVNNIDNENPGDLYGTVMVKDCWGEHTIYDRSSNDYESIRPGEHASLTGPSIGISGEDAFIINVSLWDHDSLSPDDEIAQGEIVWDPRERDWSSEKPLEELVSGKYGSVSVGYSIIREAFNATISVVLINGDGESPADVYGTIKASRVLGGSSTTRMLFNRSNNEYVEVRPQEYIPLTRPVFPVPVNSYLKIDASLWDYDSLSSDDQIALGSVQFTPKIGTQKEKITGKYGEVQVSITCE